MIVSALCGDSFCSTLQASNMTTQAFWCEFAKGCLKYHSELEANVASETDEFALLWKSFPMVPLRMLMARLAKVCRAVLHVYCVDPIAGIQDTEDGDVYYFTDYSGNEPFERAIKRIFADQSLWWHSEIVSMQKLGATTALVKDKLKDLEAVVYKEGPLDTTELKQASDLVINVSSSIRKQKMASVLQSFTVACPIQLLAASSCLSC